MVLHSGSTFGVFLQSLLSLQLHPRNDGTCRGSVWPLPMPYPEVFLGGPVYGSVWRKKRLCLLVLLLDWFWLGRPKVCPGVLWLGRRLTAKQWRIVSKLESLAEDLNSVDEVAAGDMGRGAGKVELQDDELASLQHRAMAGFSTFGSYGSLPKFLHGFHPGYGSKFAEEFEEGLYGKFVGETKPVSHVAAKTIQADRIHFEGVPQFDPSPFLDPKTSALFEEPQRFRSTDRSGVPRVHVRAEKKELISLYQKMAATGRLLPLSAEDVDEELTSGLFAVPKDMRRDRLIMDSRPANSVEEGANRWTQCAASSINVAQLELAEDEVLRMSGQDVKDFYYQFRVGPQRLRRNALGSFLTYAELRLIFGEEMKLPLEGGFVALNTMAMGDIVACEVAQGSHLGVLLQHRCFHPKELLRYRHPCPRGPFSAGVVIDDLVFLEKLLKTRPMDEPTVADGRMATVLEAYESVHLPTNPKKAFYNSATASFWGVSVDGDKGLVRPNPQRFWPLAVVTMRCVLLGVVSISLLESLAGSWISIFVLRRRMMCTMEVVFKALHCGAGPGDVLRLSKELKSELLSFVLLGMVCVSNLRARTLPLLKATDSSSWGMAAVETVLPVNVARELGRFCLTKSVWSKMLPPGKAWLRTKQMLDYREELPDGEHFDTHPLWETVARCCSYKELWRLPHRREVHINVSELEACLREEARVGLNLQSVRCSFALDSQVALGALVKGRSSSGPLNSLLRRSLAVFVGSDLYPTYGFYPTAINPADGPTRGVGPREPDCATPDWWSSLSAGDPTGFDEWLGGYGTENAGVTHDDEFAELGYLPPTSTVGVEENGPFGSTDEDAAEPLACLSGEEMMPESGVTLSSEALALLCQIPEKYVWWPKGSDRVFRTPGAIDLYTGSGGVARALLRLGCPFVVVCDWKMGSEADLLDPKVQELVLNLLRNKAVEVYGSALICSSFSKAVTPCVRSPRFPRGLPGMRRSMRLKVKQGNQHSDFNALAIKEAEEHGIYFWLENPDGSYLWIQRGYQRFRPPESTWLYRADFCRYGTRWRKRTRVATSIPSLRGRRTLCRCEPPNHVQLRGQHPTLRIPWTAVAEPYPRGFSMSIAMAAARAVGWKDVVAGCSRSGSLRIGEAKHPGPRGSVPRRFGSLQHQPVQQPGTIALGEKCWEKFLSWAQRDIRCFDALELFLLVPLFLAHCIWKFGDYEFQRGGSLLYYRHLVLAAQRKVPALKAMSHVCWDLASRWELAEPVVHRTPMPLPLLEAMVWVAWHLRWFRWCGVALLCFHGIARAGEVLKASRRDLLLPSSLLDDEHLAAYLVLWKTKTSYRSAARVQHLKVVDSSAVSMLEQIYGNVGAEEKLYHGSASMFRHRWNYILSLLKIPLEARLTPAGLRGGGAVESYRKGESIQNLQDADKECLHVGGLLTGSGGSQFAAGVGAGGDSTH